MSLTERRVRAHRRAMVGLVAVYGAWLLVLTVRAPGHAPDFRVPLLLVGWTVVLSLVIGEVVVRRTTAPEDRPVDERDREIWRRASARAYRWVGWLLQLVFLMVLFVDPMWVANAVLATILVGTLVQDSTALSLYRQG